jgi:hypothetical protein
MLGTGVVLIAASGDANAFISTLQIGGQRFRRTESASVVRGYKCKGIATTSDQEAGFTGLRGRNEIAGRNADEHPSQIDVRAGGRRFCSRIVGDDNACAGG